MAIIVKTDLPSKVQSNELVDSMVAGANATAARVAPCLVAPAASAWAASTAYLVGAVVNLSGGEFLKATIAGTTAAAEPVAPSLGGTVVDGTVTWERIAPTADQLAEAKLVLIGMVQRWSEAGSGAVQSQQAGPFGQTIDTRQRTGFNPWPSEIERLQAICATGGKSGAFSVDTAPSLSGMHADWCSLNLGATYCSCGADIAGYPIFEA